MAYRIDPRLCPADHPCPLVPICPVEAILQPGKTGLPVIDPDLCIECGDCEKACGKRAVTGPEPDAEPQNEP